MEIKKNDKLYHLFKGTPAISLVKDKALVVCNAEEALLSAWEKIITNQILSIPIIKNNSPIGFIDVIDILSFLMKGNVGEKFMAAKCEDVINFSENDTFLRVVDTADLWTTCHVMVDFGKLRRVPILKGETLIGQLSQSDVIAWVQPFIEENPIGEKTVKDLHLGFGKDVLSIPKSKTLRAGFELLLEYKVSGIAVTGELGDLYANLSASDLSNLEGLDTLDSLDKLDITIEEFMKQVPPLPIFGYNPVFVTPSDTLKVLVRKIVAGSVHRVFVVEHLMKIRGIISLIDIISLLLKIATH